MRARHIRIAGALLGVVSALTGCGGTQEAAPAPTLAVTTAGKAYIKAGGETAYVKALRGIDEKLVAGRTTAAVDDGENICLDLSMGETAAVVEKRTVARFDTDTATAKKVVAVTKKTLCSTK